MRVLERTVFIGANVYAHYPVIRLRIDLGALEEWPSRRLGEEFIAPLLATLPGLATHGCSYSAPGGFVRRLREDDGTWMGHILEHVTLELQHLAGAPVAYGKTRSTGRPGEYYLVYAYEDPEVGIRAGELAERFLRSIIPMELHGGPPDPRFDFRVELADLLALSARNRAALWTIEHVRLREPVIVLVAGEENVSEVAQLVSARLAERCGSVGVADTLGAAGERALLREGHDAVVLATTRSLLLDSGLGITRCDVAAVLGPLHGDRDPLRLPLEIAGSAVHLVDESAQTASEKIFALIEAGTAASFRR